jgi:hypothetical protein
VIANFVFPTLAPPSQRNAQRKDAELEHFWTLFGHPLWHNLFNRSIYPSITMVLLTPSGGGFSIGTSAAPSDTNMEKSLGKLIIPSFATTRKQL